MADKNDIDFTPEEEAALDTVWDNIDQNSRFVSEPGDLTIVKQVPKEPNNDGSSADRED